MWPWPPSRARHRLWDTPWERLGISRLHQPRKSSFPAAFQSQTSNSNLPSSLKCTIYILRCCCHFPFIFNLQRIFNRPQVNILPTLENVRRHTTSYQRPIFNCSLKLRLKETRRYGPLRGPTSSSCGGLQPSAEAFFALRAKKDLIMLF